MKSNISNSDLSIYTISQVERFFPDESKIEFRVFCKYVDKAFERLEHCFSFINSKYFTENKETVFDYLHGDHYSMFLYFLSNTIFTANYDIDVSKKLFLLNKALFGIDIFYEIYLPDIFLFVHPLGTVIGRGKFDNNLIIYQGCNIGGNHDTYPTIGKYVTLHPNVSILGRCKIGDNCEFGANSMIIDKDLESNSVYFGNPKSNFTKKNPKINKIWCNE